MKRFSDTKHSIRLPNFPIVRELRRLACIGRVIVRMPGPDLCQLLSFVSFRQRTIIGPKMSSAGFGWYREPRRDQFPNNDCPNHRSIRRDIVACLQCKRSNCRLTAALNPVPLHQSRNVSIQVGPDILSRSDSVASAPSTTGRELAAARKQPSSTAIFLQRVIMF